MKHEFSFSEVCNFLRRFLAKLPAFLLPICLAFLFILNKIINGHTDCYLKTVGTLLKITLRGLLIESFEVLSVPRVR